MSPDRKARLVAKKRAQILSVQAVKATCQYNGAAGYHNAGSFERALELARMAATHPRFCREGRRAHQDHPGPLGSAPVFTRRPHASWCIMAVL